MQNKYLQTTYLSLNGYIRKIDLGDFAYGEWIIYENDNAAYHVEALDTSSKSNVIINSLLDKGKGIEQIINEINKCQNLNLSLGKLPWIAIKKSSKLVELSLTPIPEDLLKHIF